MIKIFEILKKQLLGVPIWGWIVFIIPFVTYLNIKENNTPKIEIDYSDRHRCSYCNRQYTGKGYGVLPITGCTQTSSGTKCSAKCCRDSR